MLKKFFFFFFEFLWLLDVASRSAAKEISFSVSSYGFKTESGNGHKINEQLFSSGKASGI